jgi:hypothetical protein
MVGMKGVLTILPNREPTKVWIIGNLTAEEMYVIYLETKQCQKSIYPIQPFNCIPGTFFIN